MNVPDQRPPREAPPRGFPAATDAQHAYDEADLARAINVYKFFYPTVTGAAIIKGNATVGLVPNKVFGIMDSNPAQVVFTTNADTPYGPLLLDLSIGPMVIELPPGPLIVCSIDINQRWVADMGLPGPDAGNGARHILVPPGFAGALPAEGYYIHQASSNRQIVGIRSLPLQGNVPEAKQRIYTVKVYPLDPQTPWEEPTWLDVSDKEQDGTPIAYEDKFAYWEVLKETLDAEPPFAGYHAEYGQLAMLGLERGKPFTPDARMKDLLERAARQGIAQLRAQSFADRRPDRVVWPDRKWEWASLRFEDGDFNTAYYLDVSAREKWFYQAIGASPAMFRRDAQAGSLYWLGLRDSSGAYLEGGTHYRLSVPLPVPGKLFWSVTVYDAATRSQIRTPQAKAALRSLQELSQLGDAPSVDLFFGPTEPPGQAGRWIQTTPGDGWFVYFRIYGPQTPAFDGSWKPGDFEALG